MCTYQPKSQSQIGRVGYALTDEDGNADEPEKTVQIRGQTTDDPIHHPLSVPHPLDRQTFYGVSKSKEFRGNLLFIIPGGKRPKSGSILC